REPNGLNIIRQHTAFIRGAQHDTSTKILNVILR
ncbi:MAG: hypothetical protein ACI8ZV_002438, partial [Chitinophagales bacterium]